MDKAGQLDKGKDQPKESADRARRWREENASAIESANRWVEAVGLPLEEYRQF